MAFKHVILLVLAMAASASPSGVMAAPCNPEAHAEMVIRNCFPGTSPSLMCCNVIFGSLTSGMECICNMSRTRLIISAGLSDTDINGWFNSCGGNGNELAGVCSGAQDPVSPPPPTQGQPGLLLPPPALGQPTLTPPSLSAQGQPWFSGPVKLVIIFIFILLLVFGLLAVVACGGPAGREAEKLLRTDRDIAKSVARRLNIPGWIRGPSSGQNSMTALTSLKTDDPSLSYPGFENNKKGRILSAPTILVGNGKTCIPKRGSWNYNHKRLLQPVTIQKWAVVSFSANCDLNWISSQLINCARKKGIIMKPTRTLVYEDSQSRRLPASKRVELMFEKVKTDSARPPEFLLCVLPERKNCDIYGPWKKKSLHEMGVVTQCIAPSSKMNDQYFTNVLKINAKLGGMNSALASEHTIFKRVSQIPTLILGIYVSHSCPGEEQMPSIVSVLLVQYVGLKWKYRASVRTQPPKLNMNDFLFKDQNGSSDECIISELLLDFYQTSERRKPAQIIIFRSGLCESQFSQVLDVELKQIVKACKKMGLEDLPKFTVITDQKRRTQANLHENLPPGTVVECAVGHSTRYDFCMWPHTGSVGTHYRVLLNEIGFSADEIQKLLMSMSYLNQRSSMANSVVAPVHYARLAAAQMRQIVKFGDQLPQLHERLRSSMFFC